MKTELTSGYEQLISLTAQSDAECLNKEFMSLLVELYIKAEIRLYICRRPASPEKAELLYHHRVNDSRNVEAITAHDIPNIKAINPNDDSCVIALADHEVIYPILIRGLCFGAVVIEDINHDCISRSTLLATYVAIYCNQLNLIRTSNHDALTGLFNRKTFDGTLQKLLCGNKHKNKRENSAYNNHFFAMLDIDNFKRLNDNFGHLIGDEVLLTLAQIMQKTFREDDLLFRYGGEEFTIILKNVSEDLAQAILERFRQSVANYSFPQVGSVTVSIGHTLIVEGLLPPTIIQTADKALYYAKGAGKNQVCCYEHLVKEGKLDALPTDTNDIELF